MSGELRGELRGEWKLLKVWECHRCKTLIRMGRETSTHKCDVEENELSIGNKTIEELKRVIGEQKELVENQKIIIEDRDKLIENQKNAIGSHKSTIKDQKKTIDDQKKTIDDQNKAVEYYKKAIDSQKVVIDEQNRLIKDKAEEDQNKIIEDQKRTMEGHRRAIDSQKRSIDDRDRIIDDQKKVIESQKRIIIDKDIEENVVNKNIPNIGNKDNGGIKVHILEEGKQIKDSKDAGYRENIEIEIFEKGKGKDRIIIKNGRLTKKPDDIDIIGEYTSEGFIMKGIYKN